MKKIELILGFSFVLSLLLMMIDIFGGISLLILSLSGIAVFYFLFSFFLFNKRNIKKSFNKETYKSISIHKFLLSIITGWALSIYAVGVLHLIMDWIGWQIYLMFSSIFLLAIFFISLVKYKKNSKNFYKIVILRIFIFFILFVVVYIMQIHEII